MNPLSILLIILNWIANSVIWIIFWGLVIYGLWRLFKYLSRIRKGNLNKKVGW